MTSTASSVDVSSSTRSTLRLGDRSLGTTVHLEEGERTIGWPRVEAHCKYLKPVRFGDELEVRVFVERQGMKSMTYRFDFHQDFTGSWGRIWFIATTPATGSEVFVIKTPGAAVHRLPGASEPTRPMLDVVGNAINDSSGAVRFPFLSQMSIQLVDGGSFSLGSIDLAEYNGMTTTAPPTVELEGIKADGSGSVFRTFTLDGIKDGAGGQDDFETFFFTDGVTNEFTNLASVEIRSDLFSMDNLNVISAVPIPAAAWLFMSGLIALVAISKRKV